MRRPDRTLLAALVVAAVGLPAFAATPAPCPDDAIWYGHAPPHGDGYQCARPRSDGGLERHGWTVLYDPFTRAKIEECEYRDGFRHGHCTLYSSQGALLERGSFIRGVRTGAWWFWSLPTPHGPRDSLGLKLGDPDAPAQRRRDVEGFLLDLGASAEEAPVLGEAILQYVDRDGQERRQLCGEHLCVGPGRIPHEPIFVHLGATPEQTQRDRKLLADTAGRLRKRQRDEQRAAKAEAARLAAEQRRREREEAREAAAEEDTRQCCRYCTTGQPCGNSCIAAWKTCHKGRGCAC